EMAQELNELAGQMNHMVSNLLDMARLQSGRLRLRREWQPIEDVIGVSLQQIRVRSSAIAGKPAPTGDQRTPEARKAAGV
ncbi:MAG: hypothetical protein ACRC1I_07400, partial [Pseudomonas proteolytica]